MSAGKTGYPPAVRHVVVRVFRVYGRTRFGSSTGWYASGMDARPGVTMGVEEEFLLVDPETGCPAPVAEKVLALADRQDLAPGATVQRELRASQVEAATGICATAADLRAHLTRGRAVLARAAGEAGVLAVPVGTPPLDGDRPDPIGAGRYGAIDRLYAELSRDYHACGLHVHIGVADLDSAVAVVGMVNPWLPTLLALSVNSPFHSGRDTGYGSWRIVEQSRFPSSGLAPGATDHRSWRREVDRLVDCGVLVDETQTFWLARPSPRLPTVELRVADTARTVDDAIVQALLGRALVRTALADLAAGHEPPSLPPMLAEAAVWSAARYGPAGPAVDLRAGARTTGQRLVRALLAHTHDALAETDDLDEVDALLREPRRTGARHQRGLAATAGLVGLPRAMALRPTTLRPTGR